MSRRKINFTIISSAQLEALRKDRDRLNAIESSCWDVRFLDSPNGMDGDSSIGIEIVGHYMGRPCERVMGEDWGESLRRAIDQTMTVEAYPPERPEYDRYGNPERRSA